MRYNIISPETLELIVTGYSDIWRTIDIGDYPRRKTSGEELGGESDESPKASDQSDGCAHSADNGHSEGYLLGYTLGAHHAQNSIYKELAPSQSSGEHKAESKNWHCGYKSGYQDAQVDYTNRSIKLPTELFAKCLVANEEFQATFEMLTGPNCKSKVSRRHKHRHPLKKATSNELDKKKEEVEPTVQPTVVHPTQAPEPKPRSQPHDRPQPRPKPRGQPPLTE